MTNENKIFVFYVAIGNLDLNDISEYMSRVNERFFTDDFMKKFEGSEVILLPVRGENSKIECINPVYITEPELIREHRLKIDELHEMMDKFKAETAVNQEK